MTARKSAYADCPRCGAHLIWVTLNGKRAPLNRVPDDQGEIWAYQNAAGGWNARVAVPGALAAPPWKRYGIHDGGCADASGTPEAPRNVTQLATWRQAQSAHAAAQRRGRWKRPPPGITGYRINPP